MVHYSGSFVLAFSLTFFSSLHTVTLNRDGEYPLWTLKNRGAEPTDHIQPADSSLSWTKQTSRAKMDTTTPSMTGSLFSEHIVNSEKNSTRQEDLGVANFITSSSQRQSNKRSSQLASSATWTQNKNLFKTNKTSVLSDTPPKRQSSLSATQGNGQSTVTELSVTSFGHKGHSSKSSLLAELRWEASPQSAAQTWNKTFHAIKPADTPKFIHFRTSQTSLDEKRVETGAHADWGLGQSEAISHRLDTGDLSDGTGLGQRQADQLTTVQHDGMKAEDFAKKPPHEMMVVTDSPKGLSLLDDWHDNDFMESSSQPDCNMDPTGVCNSSDDLQSPHSNHLSTLSPASPAPSPGDMTPPPTAMMLPVLVPLLCDWKVALATWGLAWELQVYGLACVFSLVAALSALGLLCLPMRWPSDCTRFGLLHLLQLLAGTSRALWLFYDPYGQRGRLPAAWARLLHEAAYPCLAAAFGLLLLLLCGRSPAQVLLRSTLRRCSGLLAALVLVHAGVVGASVAVLRPFPRLPVAPLLPPSAFVLLSSLLATSYVLLYCRTYAAGGHVYQLSEVSPDDPGRRAGRCPLAEARVWERAADLGLLSALFLLACAGLRVYAMVHAGGLAPWPWWGFQLSCRLCEAGVCLSLALVITHPLLCCGVAPLKLGCWGSLLKRSPAGGGATVKPPILSSSWSKRPGEKLGLCDGMTRHESESVPLYTLVEMPLCESDGLDLHYPSSPSQRASAQLPRAVKKVRPVSPRSSLASLAGDSTCDLRPPSPIDLRRSIDEALNSEALFHCSLFGSSRLSLSIRGPPDGQPCRGTCAEPALYRTASCGEVDTLPSPPQRSGAPRKCFNSKSMCGGSRSHGVQAPFYSGFGSGRQSSLPRGVQLGNPTQKQYMALGSSSSRESLFEEKPAAPQIDEQAVQAEFVSVCRQMDAQSVSSDTIEL
ncbi:proline-rich transmembrane protein 4 [Brachyhypopomus gauderio]|uniref:proline-rich transmembrane protein 4 n=1 Tax=Brachyhypopomus gauderio TaxID=698409 RepID=UPI004041F98B